MAGEMRRENVNIRMEKSEMMSFRMAKCMDWVHYTLYIENTDQPVPVLHKYYGTAFGEGVLKTQYRK